MLRRWWQNQNYGLWLLALTAVLAMLFDAGLEPFATCIRRYWFSNPTRSSLDWYGGPWVNFLGWAASALLTLAFATPALINKKPVPPPPDYHPLIVWLLLTVLFGTVAAVHHFWPAVVVIASGGIGVGVLATRRQPEPRRTNDE